MDSSIYAPGAKFVRPQGFDFLDNDDNRIEFFFEPTQEYGRRNILPLFYYQNQDSSTLIIFEVYKYRDNDDHPFLAYHIDFNQSIFYESTAFGDMMDSPFRFYNVDGLIPSKADRIVEFNFKDRFVDDFGYKKHRSIYYLKNNKLYIKGTYLFRDSTTDIDEFIRQNKSLVQFVDPPRPVNIDHIIKRYGVQLHGTVKESLLSDSWSKGEVYSDLYYFNGEKFAFRKDSFAVSVQLPTNKIWPYHNATAGVTTNDTTKWRLANQDFKKYLSMAKGPVEKLSDKALKSMNADDGYLFDFSHNKGDLYRDEYQDCKVILLHKHDIGAMLIKYYYKDKDRKKVDKLIRNSLSDVIFSDTIRGNVFPY